MLMPFDQIKVIQMPAILEALPIVFLAAAIVFLEDTLAGARRCG
jgi:hypothetical protein